MAVLVLYSRLPRPLRIRAGPLAVLRAGIHN